MGIQTRCILIYELDLSSDLSGSSKKSMSNLSTDYGNEENVTANQQKLVKKKIEIPVEAALPNDIVKRSSHKKSSKKRHDKQQREEEVIFDSTGCRSKAAVSPILSPKGRSLRSRKKPSRRDNHNIKEEKATDAASKEIENFAKEAGFSDVKGLSNEEEEEIEKTRRADSQSVMRRKKPGKAGRDKSKHKKRVDTECDEDQDFQKNLFKRNKTENEKEEIINTQPVIIDDLEKSLTDIEDDDIADDDSIVCISSYEVRHSNVIEPKNTIDQFVSDDVDLDRSLSPTLHDVDPSFGQLPNYDPLDVSEKFTEMLLNESQDKEMLNKRTSNLVVFEKEMCHLNEDLKDLNQTLCAAFKENTEEDEAIASSVHAQPSKFSDKIQSHQERRKNVNQLSNVPGICALCSFFVLLVTIYKLFS